MPTIKQTGAVKLTFVLTVRLLYAAVVVFYGQDIHCPAELRDISSVSKQSYINSGFKFHCLNITKAMQFSQSNKKSVHTK